MLGPGDASTAQREHTTALSLPLLCAVFVFSGFAALTYQVVWQRSLCAIYGVDIQSTTIVVTAFMLGLGMGSVVGGALSTNPQRQLVVWFAAIEIAIGLFGLASLPLFRWIGSFTAGASRITTFAASFALLLVPTGLMGATLPLLTAHAVRRLRNVGRSVGLLYFVNTLGSALASFVTAVFVLGHFGQSGSVAIAAASNAVVGGSILVAHRIARRGR
jgi:predicted membrane-bound spermidine synthase